MAWVSLQQSVSCRLLLLLLLAGFSVAFTSRTVSHPGHRKGEEELKIVGGHGAAKPGVATLSSSPLYHNLAAGNRHNRRPPVLFGSSFRPRPNNNYNTNNYNNYNPWEHQSFPPLQPQQHYQTFRPYYNTDNSQHLFQRYTTQLHFPSHDQNNWF